MVRSMGASCSRARDSTHRRRRLACRAGRSCGLSEEAIPARVSGFAFDVPARRALPDEAVPGLPQPPLAEGPKTPGPCCRPSISASRTYLRGILLLAAFACKDRHDRLIQRRRCADADQDFTRAGTRRDRSAYPVGGHLAVTEKHIGGHAGGGRVFSAVQLRGQGDVQRMPHDGRAAHAAQGRRQCVGGKPHQQGAKQAFQELLGDFHGVRICHAPLPNTLSHNSAMKVNFANVGIVGTGAMGRGIAQIAAQAGSTVKLMDAQAGAAEKAREAICAQWDKLVEKGRLEAAVAKGHKDRLLLAGTLADLAGCDLVIEAIVERLDVKRALFAELEALVPASTVLASNTSSLSVTAIAAALKHPERLAGFHFFNPVPLMKVVEVIAGLKTSPPVCEGLSQLCPADGPHTRAGARYARLHRQPRRPGLRHRGAAHRQRRHCRFRHHRPHPARPGRLQAGPFELMDLTALDVSHPVMESIYHQYYEEARYRPSVITAQRLAGGMLGRKTGEGFYRYADGAMQVPPEPAVPEVAELPPVWVSPRASRRSELLLLLKNLGAKIETGAPPRRRP